MELEHGTIETNGIKLHVVQVGPKSGVPVVLLHGFPEFWYGWRKQIPALVEAGCRVIVPDQRGYNLSDKPKGVKNYAVSILVDDIVGLIDALEYEKVNLVGHDWGAVVAWMLAMKHPERLHKLGIMNVPHPAVMRRFLTRDQSRSAACGTFSSSNCRGFPKRYYPPTISVNWSEPCEAVAGSTLTPMTTLRNTRKPGQKPAL